MNEAERGQQLPHHPMLNPNQMFITIDGSLPHNKRFNRPLVVQVENDEGEFLVIEPRFFLHAVGSTLPGAIAEFKRIIVDELEQLTADEEELGPHLQAHLQYLRTIVRNSRVE